jgi:glycosyltransferase involved in cell wall biosynthesis
MISVCVCTHNPDASVFDRCLAALRLQELPADGAELLVIDNASDPPLESRAARFTSFPFPSRLVREENLGLSHARARACLEARGHVLAYVDDDNFLSADFVRQTDRFFSEHPSAGAVGGRVLPLSEVPFPPWFETVGGYLAVRDLGDQPRCLSQEGWMAPCGAGMAVRKVALQAALAHPLLLVGRQGKRLSSGEDTEICYRIRLLGWELWYDPALTLLHFLSARRLELSYLERLSFNFGINTPYIEFYSSPDIPWRRIFYLRRSFFHWRIALAEQLRLDRGAQDRAAVESRLKIASFKGLAASFLKLAFSRPVWEEAARSIQKQPLSRLDA